MKTKQSLQINLILLGVLIGSGMMNAQTNENLLKLQPFGFGLHIEQFKWSDIEMEVVPANKIIISINVSQKFRIEPEIGYNSFKNKNADLTDKSIHLGCNLFGMGQKNNTNIYGGLKFGVTMHRNEYEDWNSGDTETNKLNFISIGPALGCEYFFGTHFSFGGELSLKYTSYKDKEREPVDEGQSFFTTDTGLILRFYF